MSDPSEILAFWFGEDPEVKRDVWFHGGPAFDDACRRFESEWNAVRAGEREAWRDAPSSLLAYVILADQIPRNLFREDGRAYATDDKARAAARRAVEQGWDRVMRLNERMFLYLPFEHSEDIDDQRTCLRLFEDLGDPTYQDYARKHLELIERFGRFPHRNAMLNRASTPAEAAFLNIEGRGF